MWPGEWRGAQAKPPFALVREGGGRTLRRPDLEVVGDAEDGLEAIALTRQLAPDLIPMDVRMPQPGRGRGDPPAGPGRLARPHVILTTYDLDEYVHQAIRAGASGFLLKDVQPAQLVEAIRVVAAGRHLS